MIRLLRPLPVQESTQTLVPLIVAVLVVLIAVLLYLELVSILLEAAG